MRVEGLDLQEPVVGIAVAVEEVESVREDLHRGKVLLVADELAVVTWAPYFEILSPTLSCASSYFSRSRSQGGCTIAFHGSLSCPRTNSKVE